MTEENIINDMSQIEDQIKDENLEPDIPIDNSETLKSNKHVNRGQVEKFGVNFIKVSRKQELINNIKLYSGKVGRKCMSDRDLKRAKISLLERELAKVVEQGAMQLSLPTDDIREKHKDLDEKKEEDVEEEVDDVDPEYGAEMLFRLHLLTAEKLEMISDACKDMKYTPKLKGLTKNVLDSEEDLRTSLKDLLNSKHGKTIKKYMSPMVNYIICVGGTVTRTMVQNIDVKNELRGTL
jgi:hypothetical protein